MKRLNKLVEHYEHIFKTNLEIMLYLDKHHKKMDRDEVEVIVDSLVSITQSGIDNIADFIGDSVDHFRKENGYDLVTDKEKKPALKVLSFPKPAQKKKE